MISLVIKLQIKLQDLRYALLQNLLHKEMKNQSKYLDKSGYHRQTTNY